MADGSPNFEMAKVVIPFEVDPDSMRRFVEQLRAGLEEAVGHTGASTPSPSQREGVPSPLISDTLAGGLRGTQGQPTPVSIPDYSQALARVLEVANKQNENLEAIRAALDAIVPRVMMGSI